MDTIVRLGVGCAPDSAVSNAILLQSEVTTFLIFRAKQETDGGFVDAGWAVAEFEGCGVTKFGYPNDEARFSIPHLKEASYDICEVVNSEWVAEINHLNLFAFPNLPNPFSYRHFLIGFHDSTFECLAEEMHLSLTKDPLTKVLAELSRRLDPGEPRHV